MENPRVFIGSSSEGLAIAEAIFAHLSHETKPKLWTHELFLPGHYPMESLEKQRDLSARLVDALARLEIGEKARFSGVLEGLARQPVAGLWLREIHLIAEGQRYEFVGSSLKPELLPRWLNRLEEEPAFAGSTFEVLRMNRSPAGLGYLDFSLGAAFEAAR